MKTPTQSLPSFIYLTGCDGTGKTTQARLLIEHLRRSGLRVQHQWLRFPFLCSLPFLAYARLRGLSWYEVSGDVRHGYWSFENSWWMKNVFPWALLLDALLVSILRVRLPLMLGFRIVCDRFVVDMLADLMVATGQERIAQMRPGRYFPMLLPRKTALIFLDLDPETIRLRRRDLVSDRSLDSKLDAYRTLAVQLHGTSFLNDGSIRDLSHRIQSYLGLSDAAE